MKIKQDEIFKFQNGSAQPHIYSSDLSKHIKIKVPKNKQLIQNLEPTFQQIERLQQEVKQAEQLYNKLILELAEEAILQSNQKPMLEKKEPEQDIIINSEIEAKQEVIVKKSNKRRTKLTNAVSI